MTDRLTPFIAYGGATAAFISPNDVAGFALAVVATAFTLRRWWIMEQDRKKKNESD